MDRSERSHFFIFFLQGMRGDLIFSVELHTRKKKNSLILLSLLTLTHLMECVSCQDQFEFISSHHSLLWKREREHCLSKKMLRLYYSESVQVYSVFDTPNARQQTCSSHSSLVLTFHPVLAIWFGSASQSPFFCHWFILTVRYELTVCWRSGCVPTHMHTLFVFPFFFLLLPPFSVFLLLFWRGNKNCKTVPNPNPHLRRKRL